MPALPKSVTAAVDRRSVKVFYADSTTVRYWNDRRSPDDIRMFCGWYWYIETNGRATRNENGPYRTQSAAYRDAFLSLNLERLRDTTTQVRGTGVVSAPARRKTKRTKTASGLSPSLSRKLETAAQGGRRLSRFEQSMAASRRHLGTV